jgi:hypothetical protein
MIRLASEQFVPVAGDDWYQRRRDDAEGAFFRSVANQGPRKGPATASGGPTRQGIYCLTASGKLLAFRNAQDAKVMLQTVRQALARWQALPAEERRPGAVKVRELDRTDPNYTRTPPPGGLILDASTRILDRDGKGCFVKGTCSVVGGDKAARDHLWLKKAEWQALVPEGAKKGQTFPMPAAVAGRLLRFHLLDNTRGEPNYWEPGDVRRHSLTWTVEEANAREVRLVLVGTALLEAGKGRFARGFDVALRGHLTYDRAKKAITRFDVVAVGDHWGHGTYTGRPRPGRQPLGVALALSAGTRPGDLVPPQGLREVGAYFARGR